MWVHAPGGATHLPPVLVAGTGASPLCRGKEGQGSGAEVGFESLPKTESPEVKGSERRRGMKTWLRLSGAALLAMAGITFMYSLSVGGLMQNFGLLVSVNSFGLGSLCLGMSCLKLRDVFPDEKLVSLDEKEEANGRR